MLEAQSQPQTRNKLPCFDFQKGKCVKNPCRFSHDPSKKGGRSEKEETTRRGRSRSPPNDRSLSPRRRRTPPRYHNSPPRRDTTLPQKSSSGTYPHSGRGKGGSSWVDPYPQGKGGGSWTAPHSQGKGKGGKGKGGKFSKGFLGSPGFRGKGKGKGSGPR